MEILQKHKYYSILGGIVIGYMLLYGIFVFTMKDTLKKKHRTVRQANTKIKNYIAPGAVVPTEDLVAYHSKIKDELTSSLEDMKTFYEGSDGRDQYLEKWFDLVQQEIERNGQDSPDLGKFQAVYSKERDLIINKYLAPDQNTLQITEKGFSSTANNVGAGDPFGNNDPNFATGPTIEEVARVLSPLIIQNDIRERDIKSMQKKFWIIEEILQILERSRVDTLAEMSLENPKKVTEQFKEHIITLKGLIHYPNVPRLIQNILNNKKLMVEIIEINLERKDDYRPEEIEIFVKHTETEKEAEKNFFAKQGGPTFPPVRYTLQCRIWDYDAKKAPQTEEEEE